jgi:hypothetical protein
MMIQLIYFCKHFVKTCDDGKRRGSSVCGPPKKPLKEFAYYFNRNWCKFSRQWGFVRQERKNPPVADNESQK